ncbi:MAG: hypothetical protein WCD76_18810 [Pyrinomonadaceae bacterium]
MLKGLKRKLVTLSVLAITITALLSSPTPSKAWGGFCWRGLDENGQCYVTCCPMPGGGYCDSSPC